MITRYIDLRDIEEWIGQGWQVQLIGYHHAAYGIAWRYDDFVPARSAQ